MITLKELADFSGITNECLLGMMVVNSVFVDEGISCVFTSGTDWIHSSKYSDHYKGNAFDFRINHLTEVQKNLIVNLVRQALNSDYIVIVHNTHVHVSYRPSGDKRLKIYIEALKSKGYKIIEKE